MVVPGNRIELPFKLYDDLNQETGGLYHLHSEKPIIVDSISTYSAEKEVILKGDPGTKGTITITKIGLREVTISFEVSLAQCPPFFEFSNELKKCKCAFDENAKFKNIHSCNLPEYKSSLLHGYWAGYDGEKKAENFLYGICPLTYCFKVNDTTNFQQMTNWKMRCVERKDQGFYVAGVEMGTVHTITVGPLCVESVH